MILSIFLLERAATAAAAPAVDLTPIIPAAALLLLGGVVTIITRAAQDRAGRIPTVAQVWARMDTLDEELTKTRGQLFTVKRVFLAYVGRARSGGSLDLTEEETAALADDPAGK